MNISIQDPELADAVRTICCAVQSVGGRALLVGGYVRDAILGLSSKDIDIEVYGVEPETLTQILAEHFTVDVVGQAFGVIKVHHFPIDVSIPRRESKVGLGHKGFEIHSDPSMIPEEAALRRDYTINTVSYDPITCELVDPCEGLDDIKRRILRHTSDQFTEDPLRVLRGMQFIARFELDINAQTLSLCKSIEPEGLVSERIFEEWKKMILRGTKPSRGLRFLKDCRWIRYYPELEALIGCEQDPDWHPEGDVWNHTLHCMDAFAAEKTGDEWEDLVVGLAVLCHDMGKPSTTSFTRGKIRSLKHESEGKVPTRSFLKSLTNHRELILSVVPLVTNHMLPVELHKNGASDTSIRRLARRVERIDRLVRVAKADQMGRPPIVVETFEAGEWLIEKARGLEVGDAAPKPIMMGRHLIELGMTPSPEFGKILRVCYEAQIEGEFLSLQDGLAWVRKRWREVY